MRGTDRRFPSEWREFIDLLTRHRVKFMLVGAHALAVHGRPRYTADLDIWVKPSPANAKRVCAALDDFGFGAFADEEYFATSSAGFHGMQLGVEPKRIDIIKDMVDADFDDAWARRKRARVSGRAVYIIGRADYIANKRRAGRLKDLADVERLTGGGADED